MAAFSSSSFSTTAFSEAAFDFGTAPPPDPPSTGGISPEDAKRYREYLERLTGIKNAKQITPEIIEAAEAITEIPVEANQVIAIALEKPSIDLKKLAIELSEIQNYINRMELAALEMQRFLREQEDELALMLLI